MNTLAIPSLLFFCVLVFTGAFVFFKRPASALNQVFLVIAVLSGLDRLVEHGYLQSRSLEEALVWRSIDVSWPLLTISVLYFSIVLTKSSATLLKSGLLHAVLLIPAVVFVVIEAMTSLITSAPEVGRWGWHDAGADINAVSITARAWASSVWLMSAFLFYRHVKRASLKRERRRALLVAVGILSASLCGVVSLSSRFIGIEGVLPADYLSPFLLVLVGRAVLKDDELDLTPTAVAQSIVTTMSDSLFLIYPDLTIASCNRTALDLLRRTDGELKDRPIDAIFESSAEQAEWIRGLGLDAGKDQTPPPLETELITKQGVEIPVSLVGSALKRHNGVILGYLIIARDITDKRETDSELDQYRHHLEQLVEERMGDLESANQALESSSRQLQLLSERLSNAKEEESIRISKALQNDLGQILSGIKIEIELLNKQLAGETAPGYQKRTDGIITLVDTAIKSIQKITRGLRPLMLEEIGLAASIENTIDNFRKRYGIECVFENHLTEDKYGSDLSIVIFRIIQESLTNVARHSKATLAKVTAQDSGDTLTVSIVDNGVGIKESELTSVESVGILGMMERARTIGGSLNVFRKKGSGTQIDVAVPIRR